MYSSESKFAQGLARKLKPYADSTRIESHITPGVPDIYLQFYLDGDMWLELKNYKCTYAKWDNGIVTWRPGQQAWAATYHDFHANKCVVTLIALSDGYYFVPMTCHFPDCKIIKNDFYFIPKKEWSKLSAKRIVTLLQAASTLPVYDGDMTARYVIYRYLDKFIKVPKDFDLDIFMTEYDPNLKPEILDYEGPENAIKIAYKFLKEMKFEILRTIFTMEDNSKITGDETK